MSRWPRYVIERRERLVHLSSEGTSALCGNVFPQGQVITKSTLVPTCFGCVTHWWFLQRRWPEAGW